MSVCLLAPDRRLGADGYGPIEPRAGTWKPWVLKSGSELRLRPPPDAQATASEMQELRALAGRRDSAALERIYYWDFSSPVYRWNEMLTDTAAPQNFGAGGGLGIRAFAMLNVAIHDALIAAWDSKYAHNRRRPGEADPKLASALPRPGAPRTRVSIRLRPVPAPLYSRIFFLGKPSASLTLPRRRHEAV